MATRDSLKKVSLETDENQSLQEQVKELQRQLQALLSMKQVEPMEIPSADMDEEKYKVNSDDYIKVMSLCPHTLNLTTEPYGKGKIFVFRKFGEVKRILYGDLVHIIENHSSFLDQGLFYILNEKVIRRHGLNDTYDKILKKEVIEKIIEGNQSDAANVFKSASEKQQDFICDLIISKIVKGESIDLNLVDRLSRIVANRIPGFDIQQKAEEAKAYSELK